MYKNDAKFGHIGLPGNRRKNKRITAWCYNARSVTNHIADFAPLLLLYKQVTVPKGANIARTGLRSDIHLRERSRTNVRPCHCAGIQIDPAIVRVCQSIKPSHCAGIFKQYNPALDQNKIACLLAGHT